MKEEILPQRTQKSKKDVGATGGRPLDSKTARVKFARSTKILDRAAQDHKVAARFIAPIRDSDH
jgi:hypothetical protein